MPDCVVVAAPREAVEEITIECATAGVGGVIVFASGYAETGKEERIAQQHRLAAIARDSNMRIVGPNTIGLVNAPLDMRVTFMDITPIPPPRRHAIGMVSQSGALGMALAQHQLAFAPVQLRGEPVLTRPLDDLQGIVQQRHRLLDLPRDLVSLSQEGDIVHSRAGTGGAVSD